MRERNGASKDYAGIGWGSPAATNDTVDVAGASLFACEGEHWNGEDTVRDGDNDQGACTGAKTDDTNHEYNVALFQCSDPGYYPAIDLDEPVGARVSAEGDDDFRHGALYVALRISGLGNAHAFAAGCQKATEDGARRLGAAAGDDECQGENGQGAAGIYLQDNTPGDVLASIVSAARLTKGTVTEDGDCTQEEYEESAYLSNEGEDPTCGRDNTAISVEFLA